MGTPREDLAAKLRQARLSAGYPTQSALAHKLTVSRPVISKAENPVAGLPGNELVTAWAAVTGAPLDELIELIERTKSGFPDWFMPYLLAEAKADMLRYWQPTFIPGLFQTESYARAQLEVESYPRARLDELVAARMERQRVIIGGAHITAIIDDLVLRRCVGSPAIMAEQCAYLATLAEHSDIAFHVVPEGTNMGLWGGFDIASRGNSLVTVCLSAIEDIPSTSEALVGKVTRAFEQLLGAAQSRADSLTQIRTAEEEWKTRI